MDREIARLAERQHGVVHVDDLHALGLTNSAISRRVDAGRLHRKGPRTYAVGHEALSEKGEWMAAVLTVGPKAAWLSGVSAAQFRAVWRGAPPPRLEVLTTSQRGRTIPSLQVVRARRVDPRDVTVIDGIPVVTVPRLLVELSATLTAGQLANVIHEAAYRNLFDASATRAAAQRATGRHHLDVLHRALELYEQGSAGTRSRREDRIVRALLKGKGPKPIVGAALTINVTRIEVDLLYPDAKLAVEIDGPGHRRPRTQREDRLRDALLRGGGYDTLRIATPDPQTAVELIADRLIKRQRAG
ncbi:MAG TPA: type IV toxin-antitoxin system AbiEi family antitoxin domain-containing protein [Solirubrobacteraceae bacterium]|nr:type IV toxin-antitoxin system AbiEi family antitoxin domain-containing protein [Solirubrobacteraceae bacterium]